MKLHVLSDLHCEGSSYSIVDAEADVTILAGDIISCWRDAPLKHLASLVKNIPHPVLYVPGNHEYYGGFKGWIQGGLRKLKIPNLILLDNETYTLGGVKFIGSTLWSKIIDIPGDLRFPMTLRSPYKGSMVVNSLTELVEIGISDFTAIKVKEHKKKDRTFTVQDMNRLNDESEQFLKKEIAEGTEKKVVITHFPPSFKSLDPRFEKSSLNDYFMNAKDHLFPGVDVWIHGHTHSSCRYDVGSTRVYCNPRGYQRTNFDGTVLGCENAFFDERLIVNV